MPQFIGTINPVVTGLNTQQNIPSDGFRAVIIGNDSGFTCLVKIGGTAHTKTLYPATVDIFYLYQDFNGTIDVIASSNLSNQTSFPGNYLQFDGVGIDEKISENAYPMQLTRAINTGNPSSTTVTNFLQSDNAPLGTQFIEVTPAAAPGSTFSFLNDGTVTIKGDVAGVLTTLLQLVPGALAGASSLLLGDATRTIEMLGTLKTDKPIDIEVGSTVLPGGTSGTATLFQITAGVFKCIIIFQSNFRTAAGAQTIAFPNPFTLKCKAFIGNSGTAANNAQIALLSGGVAQNIQVINTIAAATGGAVVAQLFICQNSIGDCEFASDTIQFQGGGTTAHNAILLFIGQ